MTVDMWALLGLFGAIAALLAIIDDWRTRSPYNGWGR